MKRTNIVGTIQHTVLRHQMISDGDFVAVGLSGGKDSMTLLHALERFRRFGGIDFRLGAIMVDPGFQNFDIDSAKKFCEELGVELTIVATDIAEIVFDIRNEKNPCSLCANMRRGALATNMQRLGMNKLALGHHEDDLVSTFFMNLVYGGRIKTLDAMSFLDRSGITVIRPMIYLSEDAIKAYVRKNNIPVVKSPCPVDKKTSRESAKQMAETLYATNQHAKSAIINAVKSLVHSSQPTGGAHTGQEIQMPEALSTSNEIC